MKRDPERALIDRLDPRDWERVAPLLDAALEMDPLAVSAYLDRACASDPELRRWIEAFLRAESMAEGFLSEPLADLGQRPPDSAVPSADAPPAGAAMPQRAGRYRIQNKLGRGGMGVVYLGCEDTHGRQVALKVLPENLAADATRIAFFLSEARLLSSLHHPNIARIHGVERTDSSQRVLVLEFVEGQTLAARLATGRLPLREALDVARQVAQALAETHARGIVHRDLKPSNLMLTESGLVKVLDFGIATHMTPARSGDPNRQPATPHGYVRGGTAGYMSPEQIRGVDETLAVDAFALGCVLYECLCGSPAFIRADRESTLAATLEGDIDLDRLPSGTPVAVRLLLKRLLAPQPSERGGLEEAASLLGELLGQGERRPHTTRRLGSDDVIPVVHTPFIGRARELEECADALSRSRVVTLTGAGGCGKTRLAIELAYHLHPGEFEVIWFVDLSSAQDEESLVAAVLAVAGVGGSGGVRQIDAILSRLSGRRSLLILDNCEHVIAASVAVVRQLAEIGGHIHVLATSREWLGAPGELILRVSPLPVPDPEIHSSVESIAANESVRLFRDHAIVARPEFTIDHGNAEHVARICRALDGIPLAIELAAALLARHELAEVTADMLDFGDRDSANVDRTRHATLMSAIALSYALLDEPERRYFERLSVFSGSWSLEAATAVCGDGGDMFDVLDHVTRLMDQSLVMADFGHREPRYRFLEPVRAFAQSKLGADSDHRRLVQARSRYFAELAQALAPRLVGGEDQLGALDSFEADHQNFLAVLRACCTAPTTPGTADALHIARSIWRFWYMRGHLRVGRETIASVLALPDAGAFPSDQAHVLAGAGVLSMYMRDDASALGLCRSALRMHRAAGDVLGEANALNYLGGIAAQRGRPERARVLFEGAKVLYGRARDTRCLALILNNLGALARQKGDLIVASQRFEEALPLARTTRNLDDLGLMLVNSALVNVRLGNITTARERIDEALTVVREVGAKRLATAALEVASEVLLELGHAEDAARSMGSAEHVRSSIGVPADGDWRRAQQPFLDRLRGRLDDARYRELVHEGSSGSLSDALDRIQPLVRIV